MKREVKIGIFAVTMILAAWAGIRFLQGLDIFSRNVEYYAAYDQISGVQASSPIMMKGVKIGTVSEVLFDPQRSEKVYLRLTIQCKYRIPTNSEAKIFSNGLMGNKAIEILYGSADTYLKGGDTLRSSRDRDLMDMAGSELEFFKQKVAQLTGDISTTLSTLNRLMGDNEANLHGTIAHLNTLSGELSDLLVAEKQQLREAVDGLSKFSTMLGDNAPKVDSILGSVNALTTELSEEAFAERLSGAVASLDLLLAGLNRGDGSLGQLLHDKALYDSLTVASGNLSALLENLKAHPERYIHLSLFGRDPDKMQARAERRAAKAARKQAE